MVWTRMIRRHGDGPVRIHEGAEMTKLPTLDFKGMLIAVNPDYILKIEEREGKDGLPRCVIYFVDKSMLTWDGNLAALVALLL
jgi:hypothetical protein